MMKIEINDELENEIIRQSLLESIGYMYDEITTLAKLGSEADDFECEDLEDHIRDLEAMKVVYRYYSVRGDWATLDNYTLTTVDEDDEPALSEVDERLLTEDEEITLSVAALSELDYVIALNEEEEQPELLAAEKFVDATDLPDLEIDEGSL